MSQSTRLISACKHQSVDKTPIWLMRQAGRYMPEYRKLRKRYSILELIKAPELAAEVTLQPLQHFDLDAAIIFSDLLPPLEGMGLKLEFTPGDGPIFHNPLRSETDIQLLKTPPAGEALSYTLRAIEIVRSSLSERVPLIGFAGAPFTLACYAIEGRASRNFIHTKQLMYENAEAWEKLMFKLRKVCADFLIAQVAAGAQVLQIFDSWVGALSPHDYQKYVMAHTKALIQDVKSRYPEIPVIYFGTGAAGLFSQFRNLGADVIGVDWRLELPDARNILGDDVAIQGNLDPMVLCSAGISELKRQTAYVLDSVKNRKGFIFNLGHGILKETPMENVKALVNFVHEYTPN